MVFSLPSSLTSLDPASVFSVEKWVQAEREQGSGLTGAVLL